jgi:hypothetical protein
MRLGLLKIFTFICLAYSSASGAAVELVRQGGEPMGLVRDPESNRIIEFATSEWRGGEE